MCQAISNNIDYKISLVFKSYFAIKYIKCFILDLMALFKIQEAIYPIPRNSEHNR